MDKITEIRIEHVIDEDNDQDYYWIYYYKNGEIKIIGKSSWLKVKSTIINIVKITNKELVLKLKFDEEKTLGINIKITNGLVIPPDK